jgi:ferritin-like metal-binding protein YciE
VTTPRDDLVDKLHDAYCMERRALEILHTQQRKSLCDQLRARMKEHALETKWQARLLEVCLENLGAAPPSFSHKKIRHDSMDVAFKQVEILTYSALIAAAKSAGEDEIADICREILDQERTMADWLAENQHILAENRLRVNVH